MTYDIVYGGQRQAEPNKRWEKVPEHDSHLDLGFK